MSETVIQVSGLGKCYRLGGQARLDQTLPEAISSRVRRVVDWIGNTRRETAAASRSDFWALRNVSFEVDRGEVVGIIGRNGAGKSTLLKILSQITDPTEGHALVHGRVASLLEVGTGFHPELSGRENIYLNGSILGMTRREINTKFDQIVDFSGIERFLDTPIKRYSSGMTMRLAFSVAAHLEPEILVIDEVLAVGDAAFQKKCLGKMDEVARGGRTVLFVSHNMSAISQLCDKAILLEKGQVACRGPVEDVVMSYMSSGVSSGAEVDLECRQRPGASGPIRFVRASLHNHRGEVAENYSIGHDVTIRFELECLEPLPAAKLAVKLCTTDGMAISNMLDTDSGFYFERPQGRESLAICLKDIRLYPGSYTVSLWVGNASAPEVYDAAEHCLSFHVTDGGLVTSRPLPRKGGILLLTPDWHRSIGARHKVRKVA